MRNQRNGGGYAAPSTGDRAQRQLTVTAMRPAHAALVLAIHQAGLDTGNASFESTAPDWPAWDSAHLAEHHFVGLDGDAQVIGWAAASAVSERCIYAGVVEAPLYVAEQAQGAGVGRALLDALVRSTEAAGVWTTQAGIFPENEASPARAPRRRVPHRGPARTDRPGGRSVAGHLAT